MPHPAARPARTRLALYAGALLLAAAPMVIAVALWGIEARLASAVPAWKLGLLLAVAAFVSFAVGGWVTFVAGNTSAPNDGPVP